MVGQWTLLRSVELHILSFVSYQRKVHRIEYIEYCDFGISGEISMRSNLTGVFVERGGAESCVCATGPGELLNKLE